MTAVASTRRFWPGLVAVGTAAVFLAVLAMTPRLGAGGCMESYPMQCPVIEIVPAAFVATALALLASAVAAFLASIVSKPRARAVAIAISFVVLVAVMILGANISLLHLIEVRY